VRGLPTIIGSIFEAAFAYFKLELQLSSKISWPIVFLLAIIPALTEIIIKPKRAIKIEGDRNIIVDNVAEPGDVDIPGSENLVVRSSSIFLAVWSIFESLLIFLTIVLIMFLIYLGANFGFGQLKR